VCCGNRDGIPESAFGSGLCRASGDRGHDLHAVAVLHRMLLHAVQEHLVVHREVEDGIIELSDEARGLSPERNDELAYGADRRKDCERLRPVGMRAKHGGQVNDDHAVGASADSSSRRHASIGIPSFVSWEIS
jgi:hypothetical protein